MRALLDTCVIYPTVMREMLLGVAAQGAFTPVWSARIIAEWLRAARKLGPAGQVQAQGEAALLAKEWPEAETGWSPSLEARLWLPDRSDIHVLAAAVAASADVNITVNAKDFPRNVLAEERISRADPDSFLMGIWKARPEMLADVAAQVKARAEEIDGRAWDMRRFLKKARLPRLAKALAG